MQSMADRTLLDFTPRGTPTRTPRKNFSDKVKKGKTTDTGHSKHPQDIQDTHLNTHAPKPVGNNGEPGARTHRTETGTPSQMSHDSAVAVTAPTSEVHSKADAMKWMVEGVYLVEGESITAKKLSHIMLQIAVSIPKLTKQRANAF